MFCENLSSPIKIRTPRANLKKGSWKTVVFCVKNYLFTYISFSYLRMTTAFLFCFFHFFKPINDLLKLKPVSKIFTQNCEWFKPRICVIKSRQLMIILVSVVLGRIELTESLTT